MKKCSLELGGKSPLIIFSDCDMDRAVRQVRIGYRVFIRHRRSENSLSTTQTKFRPFPERAKLFHNNNSPVTLHCSPATTIINNYC